METRYKVLLLLILLLGLGAGAALTTVQNIQQPVPPQFAWTFFDKNGDPIPDIKTATISGTVTFRATVTNTPTVGIQRVTLGVFTSPDYSFVDRKDFTEISPGIYELQYDTTTIPDGEYFFEFQWLPVIDIGFGDIPMTVLTLEYSFAGGTGSSQDQQTNLPLLLGAGGIGAALVLYIVLRRR